MPTTTHERFDANKSINANFVKKGRYIPPNAGQAWWALRMRFDQTHRAVVQKMPVDIDAIISIDPNIDELLPLQMELRNPVTQPGRRMHDRVPAWDTCLGTMGEVGRMKNDQRRIQTAGNVSSLHPR
jgi:hypothetical protein